MKPLFLERCATRHRPHWDTLLDTEIHLQNSFDTVINPLGFYVARISWAEELCEKIRTFWRRRAPVNLRRDLRHYLNGWGRHRFIRSTGAER
jgi:hypothetical protein